MGLRGRFGCARSVLVGGLLAVASAGAIRLVAPAEVWAAPPAGFQTGEGGPAPATTSIYRGGRSTGSPAPPEASEARAAGADLQNPERAAQNAGPIEGESAAHAARQVGQGERLVAASLAALAQQGAIVAEFRQSAIVSGRRFVGSGRYVQSGLGEDQRFRFESSLTGQSETFHFLEVSDGVAFWSFEKHGDLAASIHRVDLRSVRRKLEGFGPLVGDSLAITPHLGGIQRILARTREWFRFDRADSALLGDEPVWTIEGRWSSEGLARLLAEPLRERWTTGTLEPAELPQGIPWRVQIVVGKRDLFPYRIEWFAVPGARPVVDKRLQLVGLVEFHDVHVGGTIDASAFVYRPAAEGLIDETAVFLESVHPLRP